MREAEVQVSGVRARHARLEPRHNEALLRFFHPRDDRRLSRGRHAPRRESTAQVVYRVQVGQ